MAYLNTYVHDAALAKLTSEGNRLDVCSQEPVTYAEATTTYTLGRKTALSIGAAYARVAAGLGRRVTVAAFTDGSATGTGTATHWAVVDTVNSRLLATNTLNTAQALTSGNIFTLAAFDIGIPDGVTE